MISLLWKNNNIRLILILLIPINHLCHVSLIINKLFHTSRSVLEINKANCLSSIPGKDGAAEFWHWDSITYVGNFLIKFLLIITTTTTTTIITIIRMIITTFSIWQNSSSSAI